MGDIPLILPGSQSCLWGIGLEPKCTLLYSRKQAENQRFLAFSGAVLIESGGAGITPTTAQPQMFANAEASSKFNGLKHG